MTAIYFHTAKTDEAKEAFESLSKLYGQTAPQKADIIIPLGGDGTLLEAVHDYHDLNIPFYGMNKGSIGFLLNNYETENLLERLENTSSEVLHPLRMFAKTKNGEEIEALAFNEVSLLREERHTAKLKVTVDGIERIDELICDGILVATPAGSTAYNLSAHGPILPLSSNVLALTPISSFRPRRWKGALIPHESEINFKVLEADKRPVSATADSTEVRDVTNVRVRESRKIGVKLLFDPDQPLDERMLKEQFIS